MILMLILLLQLFIILSILNVIDESEELTQGVTQTVCVLPETWALPY